MLTRTTADWVAALNAAGVPCGPAYRLDEVFGDPQVEHLGTTRTARHPALGPLDIIRNAVQMTGGPDTVRTRHSRTSSSPSTATAASG